jgi:uncharacterized membrane protein
LSPLFGIVIGFMTAIILVTVIIVLIYKINRRNNNHNDDQCSQKSNSNFKTKINNESIKGNNSSECHDTKSPDIIPPSIEFTGKTSIK